MSIGTVAYEGATRFLEYTAKSFKDKGVGLTHIWTDFEKLEGDFLTIAGKKAGEKASALEKFAGQLIASLDWLLQVTKARDAFTAIEKAGQAVNDAVNNTIDKVKQGASNAAEKAVGSAEKDVDGFLTRIKNSILEFFGYGKKEGAEKVEQQVSKEAGDAAKTEAPAKLETSTEASAQTEKALQSATTRTEEEAQGFLSKTIKDIKEFFLGSETKAVEQKTEQKLERAVDETLPQAEPSKPANTEKPADLKTEVPELDSSKLGDRKPLDSDSTLTSKIDTSDKSQGTISGKDAIVNGRFYTELPPGAPRQIQKKSVENVGGNGLLEQNQPAVDSAIQQGNMDTVNKNGKFQQVQGQQLGGNGKLVQQGEIKRVGEDLDFSQTQTHNGGLTSGVQQGSIHHIGGNATGKQIQEVAANGDSVQELFASNVKGDFNITQAQIVKPRASA